MADKDHEHDEELENEGSTQTLVRPEDKLKTPAMYRVIILNDDFSPRDFVVHVLKKFFGKNEAQATELMLAVHTKGSGVAGVYSFEIAETKTYQVNSYARSNQYPLKTIFEEV